MTYNASDRRQIREAKRTARQDNLARLFSVNQLMSSVQGRQYAYNLLSRCHVFNTTFNTNALSMAYAEGERNIGLMLIADIMSICADQYIIMMRESNDRSIAADARTAAASDSSDGDDTSASPDEPDNPTDAERG